MSLANGKPDEVLGDLYPFQDRHVALSSGHAMHYIEAGRAGLRRPTFLLLHGNPTWSFLYRNFVKPLSRLGRVVVPDHIGFGRSDHPEEPGYHTLERHISNLEEFAARLNLKRVIPVVQDWGGPIGLGWATRHPDRLAGLVVMNTWAFTEKIPMRLPPWFKAMKARGVGEYLYGRRNLFVESFIPRFTLTHLDDGVMDAYRHPFTSRSSRAAVVAAPRMIPTSPAHPDWATMDAIEKGLGKLDVPARILWATKDPAFGMRFAHAFHETLPRAEAPRTFEAGHFLQEDVPDALVAEITDFARGL